MFLLIPSTHQLFEPETILSGCLIDAKINNHLTTKNDPNMTFSAAALVTPAPLNWQVCACQNFLQIAQLYSSKFIN